MKQYRKVKKYDFTSMFNMLSDVSDASGERELAHLPKLALKAAQFVPERKIERYVMDGSRNTIYGRKLRMALMAYGRLDAEEAVRGFMQAALTAGVDAAWQGWADAQARDCDANLRHFLRKSALTLRG